MHGTDVAFTVFTKPWKMPLEELGRFVAGLGFEGVELPVRPGFQVIPETVASGLPEAARILADCGVRIASVAGPTDEPTIAACAAAGVPILRTMVFIPDGAGYRETVDDFRRQLDALLAPLERHGVAIGVQNHCGRWISSASGLHDLVGAYDPAQVCAVLDFGHCGLADELPAFALDIVGEHLGLVNFKNAVWRRTGSDDAATQWRSHWVTGAEGMCHWPAAVAALRQRGYRGDVCLTAEYSDADSVDRNVAADLRLLKSLFADTAPTR